MDIEMIHRSYLGLEIYNSTRKEYRVNKVFCNSTCAHVIQIIGDAHDMQNIQYRAQKFDCI